MEDQICKVCGICKSLSNFATGKNKRNDIEKIYYYKTCILCDKQRVLDKSYRYKKRNRKKLANKQKKYHKDNKEKNSLVKKQWYQNNKENVKQRIKNNTYIRRRNDPIFRMKENISTNIRLCIKKNNQPFEKYLPYTIQDLKNHLESQFESWMNWKNYGVYRIDTWDDNDYSTWSWQIDHIIPQSNFIYYTMKDEEFKKCWALSNLRPYSAKQNIIDNNRKNIK